ncbi:hypothetical protein D3C76_1474300 [compost metagenome]
MAVGPVFSWIRRMTASIPVFKLAKGTRAPKTNAGLGTSFNIHWVMIPSVPSEPISRCFRDSPLLSFTTLPPVVITSPLGKTAVSPRT